MVPDDRDRRPRATDEREGSSTARALLAVLLLLTVPLVGCADDGSDGEPPAEGQVFTAREGLETANASAEEWSSEATLAGVTMIEHPGTPDEWPGDGFAYTPDEAVGDGRIAQWAYFYIDGEDHLAVYVNEAGETFQDEEPPGQMPDEPLGDWPVDSDEAADAAREDDNVSEILEADDAEVLYALQESQRGPAWLVRASSETMEEERTMVVDAASGEAQPIG